MNTVGRRKFLATASFASGFLYVGCKTSQDSASHSVESLVPQQKSAPRIRKRWIPGVDADFKQQFMQAVTWLKANDGKTFPADDPRSYLSWERFVAIHDASCHHGDWYIFPWHRNFLNYFELACQLALDDPNFAVPYWDWTIDGRIPDEFYDQPILAVDRSLKKGISLPEEFVGPKVLDKILADENFFSFFSKPIAKTKFERLVPRSGAFEAGPHNKVHNAIGNFMAGNKSPTDPIFWLHHSNVDRIYCQWAFNHPATYTPYPVVDGNDTNPTTGHNNEEWLREEMLLNAQRQITTEDGGNDVESVIQPGLSFKNRSLSSSAKVSDLLSIETLGYSYDTIQTSRVQTQSHVAIIQSPRLINSIGGKVTRTKLKISCAIGPSKSLATLIDEFQKSKLNYASLLVENIGRPKDIVALSLRFFILSAAASEKTLDLWAEHSFNDSSYIGSYSFLNSHHHQAGEEASGDSVEFDISVWLRNQIPLRSSKTFTLVAVAIDTNSGYKAVSAFSHDSPMTLSLQFALSTKT